MPQFDVQGSLFESLGAIAPDLFADNDKYKLFAKKIWPVLASCREQLLDCYDTEKLQCGNALAQIGQQRIGPAD